jgi:hypothetical protein
MGDDREDCSRCNGPLMEIDHCGERLVGCIECNRWTRNGWLYRQLPDEDLEALTEASSKEGHE